jgi:FtsH-binding integral membrane protein
MIEGPRNVGYSVKTQRKARRMEKQAFRYKVYWRITFTLLLAAEVMVFLKFLNDPTAGTSLVVVVGLLIVMTLGVLTLHLSKRR